MTTPKFDSTEETKKFFEGEKVKPKCASCQHRKGPAMPYPSRGYDTCDLCTRNPYRSDNYDYDPTAGADE